MELKEWIPAKFNSLNNQVNEILSPLKEVRKEENIHHPNNSQKLPPRPNGIK
jgi:hypothetical protein